MEGIQRSNAALVDERQIFDEDNHYSVFVPTRTKFEQALICNFNTKLYMSSL